MSDVVIQAEGLSKLYRLGAAGPGGMLREAVYDAAGRAWARMRRRPVASVPVREVWALKDVSFSIKSGEVVGFIGRNGAGKSTLLKILSRITCPTRGQAWIRGRVGSLLEVGTGFHPELTGRENIFLNGTLLGMSRRDIAGRFDAIVDFADIGPFLDTPVKRYSSGMYVRLAFAVAAHLEPEILIVDEVLAVGDAAFQKKCLGKMKDVANQGRTVLFVSHNLGAVSSLTQRCAYLHAGRLLTLGPTGEVVNRYYGDAADADGQTLHPLEYYRRDHEDDPTLRVTGLAVNGLPARVPEVAMLSDFHVEITLEVYRPVHDASLTLILKNEYDQKVAILFSWDQGYRFSAAPGTHQVRLHVRGLPLAPGAYYADIGICQSTASVPFDVLTDVPLIKLINQHQVPLWQERPWGAVHWNEVSWSRAA